MALVVVPQVFRIVLPPLGNQIVSVVLGSAQASIIGVAELTYQTQSIGSSTFRYFELFTIAAPRLAGAGRPRRHRLGGDAQFGVANT